MSATPPPLSGGISPLNEKILVSQDSSQAHLLRILEFIPAPGYFNGCECAEVMANVFLGNLAAASRAENKVATLTLIGNASEISSFSCSQEWTFLTISANALHASKIKRVKKMIFGIDACQKIWIACDCGVGALIRCSPELVDRFRRLVAETIGIGLSSVSCGQSCPAFQDDDQYFAVDLVPTFDPDALCIADQPPNSKWSI